MENETKKQLAIGLAEGDDFRGVVLNKFGAGIIVTTMIAGALTIGCAVSGIATDLYNKHKERKLNKAKAILFDLEHSPKEESKIEEESK